MRTARRILDATLGKWLRHLCFVVVRSYFALFYNVSCSNKHLLQDLPGGLILASHVSRLDGPLLASVLYATRRVRPAVHYNEYYHPAQFLPMLIANAIPLSSPRHWPPERRAARKAQALGILRGILEAGEFVLLFPGGEAKRQPREIIRPHFSGAYEVLRAVPDTPVILVRIQGISRFDQPIHDRFWSFLFITRGRRHLSISIERVEGGLNTGCSLEDFNADLETRLNDLPYWPQRDPAPED